MRVMIREVFTGLVQASCRVVAVRDGANLRRLVIGLDADDANGAIKPGDSIAINGVCLTVAALQPDGVGFDVIAETLAKTNLGQLAAGDVVHIERALRVGDRFDGHFVQGHVDGVAKLLDKQVQADDWRLTLEAAPHFAMFLASKGSVTVDGVSLTIASLDPRSFDVALIPTTLQITQLGRREVGYAFNIECDMIGKTVVRYLQLYPRGNSM